MTRAEPTLLVVPILNQTLTLLSRVLQAVRICDFLLEKPNHPLKVCARESAGLP